MRVGAQAGYCAIYVFLGDRALGMQLELAKWILEVLIIE